MNQSPYDIIGMRQAEQARRFRAGLPPIPQCPTCESQDCRPLEAETARQGSMICNNCEQKFTTRGS